MPCTSHNCSITYQTDNLAVYGVTEFFLVCYTEKYIFKNNFLHKISLLVRDLLTSAILVQDKGIIYTNYATRRQIYAK